MAETKKKENALIDVVLVVGTQQNLSNMYSLDFWFFYSARGYIFNYVQNVVKQHGIL